MAVHMLYKCEDCKLSFEEVVDEPDNPVKCAFCGSEKVKKITQVHIPPGGYEDEVSIEPC